jgi:hypothetical protein
MKVRRMLRSMISALPALLGFFGWVAAATWAASSIPSALLTHPRLAEILVYGVIAIGGVGGLVGFWFSAESVEFLVRGYRIRSLTGPEWVYEERGADGAIQRLAFGYTALANTYRPPCQVLLPSQERWGDVVPSWARNRRTEIVARISKCLNADVGVSVEFVDWPRNEE